MSDLQFLDFMRPMPLMALPVRTTVVQVDDSILLLAPGSGLSETQLKRAGAVTDIIASNLFHCEGVPKAASVFPNARVWGPKGVREARHQIQWTHILGVDPWPFGRELSLVTIDGIPSVAESVFLHKKSRTLIMTDLLFNMRNPKGVGSWIVLNIFGTFDKLAMSRIFAKQVSDRSAFAKSLKEIEALDF